MSPTPEQGIARLEVRAHECERRLLRLEDQELSGKLDVLSAQMKALTEEVGEVHADNVWMKRAFIGAIFSLLGAMILFIITTQAGVIG